MDVVTLHVGASKCGSSAIQAALTKHPVVPLADGSEATYAVFDRQGQVAAGRAVAPGPQGRYRKSAPLAVLLDLPASEVDRALAALRAVPRPVLSNEHFLGTPEDGRRVLGRLGRPVHVVAYIRPQVDYFNSAWWQWDAWSGLPEDEWIARRLRRSAWHGKLHGWVEIPEVEHLTLRLLPGDVVADFLDVIGARVGALPPLPRVNAALPGAVLRFLQVHPDLRARHEADLAWVLPALLSGRDLGPVPWVIGPDLARRIIDASRRGNEAMLDLLDPASARAMRADPRWWDAAAYADRPAEPLAVDRPDPTQLDALAAALFEEALGGASRAAAS